MARNASNDFEIQHIVKILSELSNYNAFLEITLVNLTKINCQLISINAKDSSGEIKVKNINGDTITIDILDIYAVTQGITFLRVDCIPRSKKDIGALKKGQSALKRGQLKNCQI